MLRFSDGVNIDTSGPLRHLELKDGHYVVGNGMCIPMKDLEEVNAFLKDHVVLEKVEKILKEK